MSTSTTEQKFTTPRALATRYGVSPRTVKNWIDRGVISAIRIGKLTRIPLAAAILAIEGGKPTA